jgi:D-alanyl-D-alanine dipeptidase/carboxypeptidase
VLVNADHPVLESHAPDLAAVTEGERVHAIDEGIALEGACLRRLVSLVADAEATEDIVIVSGYRSKQEQTAIYEQSLRENGEAYTASYVALPGRSEHQTGLAVDVGERTGGGLDFIAPSFPDKGGCLAFKRLAASHGFVQRYKEGKESVTGIACEPWHFRYVGAPHAAWMESLDLCLEEYIAYLRMFSFEGERLAYAGEGWRAEIYYVAAQEAGDTAVPVPDCEAYTISGNNVDGFVVTVYEGAGYAV